MYVIEAQELTKRYKIKKKVRLVETFKNRFKPEKFDYTAALRNVSFSVESGEIFGFLGYEGAGKTTLMKILSGNLKPDYGVALVSGYDVVKERHKVKKLVGVMPSLNDVSFSQRLTISQNLKFSALKRNFKSYSERVDKVLKLVGLEALKDYYPVVLNSSQLQRLNLAKCLVADSAIYLLDEPTANTDSTTTNTIKEIIKKLKSDGKSILLTTSNLSDAEELCDRIAILNAGAIVRIEEAEKLERLGKDIFVVDLKELAPELIRNLAALEFIDKIIFEKNRIVLYGKLKKQNLVEVLELCRNYNVLSIDFREVDLKDVLLELVTEEERALEVLP
ncbi:MAG: ABC transporter ATP-binding protein [Candidatus Thermoplasmatota archaeon]|nr:ABC transporter ATP-binding protein [Candidatus Thermoplasmatota archaeon]